MKYQKNRNLKNQISTALIKNYLCINLQNFLFQVPIFYIDYNSRNLKNISIIKLQVSFVHIKKSYPFEATSFFRGISNLNVLNLFYFSLL